MHVLHLRNTSGYFGAERCIAAWVGELVPRGVRFDVAAYVHPDPSTEEFLGEVARRGATVHRLPRAHSGAIGAVARLVGIVRSRQIDVIHAHENRSHGVGWLVGGITATPVVGTVHGYVPTSEKSRRWNRINRWFLSGKRLSALTVPSSALARELADARLVPNAADGVLADGPLVADARPGVPTLGVVARLSREKGVDVFLDAAADLPGDWRLVVIGDGPDRARLEAHPAASRVRFEGYRADARERMRDLTALVVPSRTEGLPVTVLEAMGQGVPVVAAAVGGIPDALGGDPPAGWLVAPEDPAALAAAIREAVEQAPEAVARARRARERFVDRYTLSRAGDDLLALYRDVARRRR